MTIALIDADIVAFRTAASAENDDLEIALLRADKLMRDILEATNATSYVASLTGADNFRKEINPAYKANRKDKEPPRWLSDVQQFLMREWKAEPTYGFEADDMLGMLQTEETVICSIDKDMFQIPGRHYQWEITGTGKDGKQWVKEAVNQYVSELDGLRFFYKQALIGDKADNIFGVDKIGPVKAGKLIDHLTDEKDMYNTVCSLYKDPDRLEMNLDCLWIWRNENEKWSDRFCVS